MSDKKSEDFVHLHLHSEMSSLDGLGKIPEYVKAAAERGSPAIGFTDHGTMRGYVQQHEHCAKANIKPIYGLEFYMAKDMRAGKLTDEERAEIVGDAPKREHSALLKKFEEENGRRDRWHLTVWAQTQEGLRNLQRLSSASWIEGFYFKPRIDLDELITHQEGLMVATGCLASPIHEQSRSGRKRAAIEYADRLYETFGDRMYLEVQPHAIDDQRVANKLMLDFRDRYRGVKLLATQDAHYVEQHDAPAHDCMLCIGTASNLDDEDRFRFDGDEFFFKTRSQMWKSFRRNHKFMPEQFVKEALDSTLEFAERCSAMVEIDYKKALLPDPGIPEKFDGNAFKFLRQLCLDGWTWRQIPRRALVYAQKSGISSKRAIQLYAERVKEELTHIKNLRFERYFLMVRDIYREARERRIMVGPGRGSVGGSLIAYLLGITAVDPIEHGLLFERFINPARKDLPDIDMDFEDHRRGELIDYMRQKYGDDRVCQISTTSRLSAKSCANDVARVLGIPLQDVRKLTPHLITRPKHDPREYLCIKDSFEELDACKEFAEKYPKFLPLALKLEGKAKTVGIHAAGVIASPLPLKEVVPLEARKSAGKDERVVVTALDMDDVPKIGLVKLDFLGLRTLSIIASCLKKIEERHGKWIDLEAADFDLYDKKVLQGFTDHDYVGVFQYDSASSDAVAKGIPFDRFDDIATVTALNRPGTAGMSEKFKERKADPDKLEEHDFHEKVSEICGDTLGVLVYQEHAIKIFRAAGFSPSEADSVRRAIGKKLSPEEINKYREGFVAGCKKHIGVKEKVANRLMDALVAFSGYSFNKSHATEYGLIAYWTMWLKTYYPLEFFWASLLHEEETTKIQDFAREAKRRGIAVHPPHVNVSKEGFSIDEELEAIRGSLVDIKGVGKNAAAEIMAQAPYADFADFSLRVNRRKVNRGAVMALIKAGAFGEMINVRWALENIDEIWKRVQSTDSKIKRAMKKGSAAVEGGSKWVQEKLDNYWGGNLAYEELAKFVRKGNKSVEDYDREEKALMQAEVSPVSFGAHPIDAYKSFIKRELKVQVASMKGDSYHQDYDNVGHYVLGMIKGVKKHQIGDFDDNIPKDDPRYGKPYANVNIEDRSGTERRVKFTDYVYPLHQDAVNTGNGKPLLVHCTASGEYGSMRAHFAVDVAKLRQKLKTGEELTVWEKIVNGQHPARTHAWPDDETREERIQNLGFFKKKAERRHFTGVVTHVEETKDKNKNLMARLGLIDAVGHYIRVIAFASTWGDVRHAIRPGTFLRLEVELQADRGGGTAYFFNGGKVKIYKKSAL